MCGAIAGASSAPLSIVAAADVSTAGDRTDIPVTSDYRELLSSDRIDAVLVTTPPSSHAKITREALLAGKDVLVEKPPARTATEARELRDLAASNGCVLVFAYHAQHNPAVIAAAAHPGSSMIEHAHVVFREDSTQFHGPNSFASEEGALRDSGINAISILTRLLPGLALRVIRATLHVPAGAPAETRAVVEFSIGGSSTGVVDVDIAHSGPEVRRVDVRTASGMAHLDITRGTYARDDNEVAPASSTDMLREEYARMLTAFASAIRRRESNASLREIAWVEDALARARAS